jgi:uncharacterized membrane protein YphA (DoxX/SURF4 family)
MSGFTLQPTRRWLQRQLKSEAAILLPLRLFIGIGWIRAGLEKLIDPGWPAGFALAQFFHEQMASGTVVFPFYQHLLRDVFVPHALGLSWLIMIGQLLTGIAIMTGTFTNLALIMLVLSIISGFTALITYFKFPRPERREVVIRDRSREVTRPVRRAVR